MNEAQPKVVVLDLSAVPDLEYTALKALIEGEKRQRELGVSTWLVGLNPGVLKWSKDHLWVKTSDARGCNLASSWRSREYVELSAKVAAT